MMRVVVTGASGQLGTYLVDWLVAEGHDTVAWSRSTRGERGGQPLVPVDLTDAVLTERALAEADPDVIVHAAAMSAAEQVRDNPTQAQAINVEGTRRLADWCGRRSRRLVYTSTDLVFDGTKSWYREDDPAEPILAYGRTKRAAEPYVLAIPPGLVARVSLLYGPSRCGRESFFSRTLAAIRAGKPQFLFDDEFRTPLDLATAALLLERLSISDHEGIIHVGGTERVSRFELMSRAAAALGLDASLVRANHRCDVALPEPRPADVSLDTTRLASLLPDLLRPTIEEAVRSSSRAV